MTTFGLIITLLGAGSIAANILRLIQRRAPRIPAVYDRQHLLFHRRLLSQLFGRWAVHHAAEGPDEQRLRVRLQVLRQPAQQ